ncbi:Nucleic-acid-binding protein from transposon X-element [Eumeta japonica]|uniref:Nucleic-acid-binding protein from transposon X-element n=1 Tax=Eumeta variegata TaxID=151549 RepID=A0A4C1YA27_EUMVA|nr:Nucleic-acid-binding protein from transposon X-element [Eumeta japonica]
MIGVSPGLARARGPTKLSLEEMKKLFFQFLLNQGYAIPEEADEFLKGENTTTRSREVSPSPSVSSWKRSSSALSDESSTLSDDTVKGSDDDECDEAFTKPSSRSRSSAPPKVKPPPPVFLRDKTKWNMVSSECSKLHINYSKAQNTAHGIKITTNSTDEFRKLNKFLINNNLPFHTYALEEERKVKAVIKGVPIEINTDDVQIDLEHQGYSVHAVHRMHRRDGTELGMVLAILEKTEKSKIIFQSLSKICGLSGVTAEAPYRKGKPGHCHRCQFYGHAAANCYAQPRCVKCRVPHWTKECERTKEAGGEPSCYNCGQNHTANYGGCPFAPKPRPTPKLNKPKSANTNTTKGQPNLTHKVASTSSRGKNMTTNAGGDGYRPAPLPTVNPWFNKKERQQAKETT